jgi:geranylgeranyl pyrophosphate synthase
LVFQIIDDILDATATAEQLGKSVGGDKKRKKNTFLNFYSEEEARFYAEQLTREAVTALKRYPDSDALISLAEWLLTREK